MVDSCLHCKFRYGAWRPRADFQDRVLSFEDRNIYIDGCIIVLFVQSMIRVLCSDSVYFQMHIMRVVMILFRLYVSHT